MTTRTTTTTKNHARSRHDVHLARRSRSGCESASLARATCDEEEDARGERETTCIDHDGIGVESSTTAAAATTSTPRRRRFAFVRPLSLLYSPFTYSARELRPRVLAIGRRTVASRERAAPRATPAVSSRTPPLCATRRDGYGGDCCSASPLATGLA